MNNLYNSLIQSQDQTNGASIPGVALATVTNVSEVSKGRIKVKFQWRKSGGNNDEIWARIIIANKGIEPLFEEHDVVLVAFEQGNFEYPFVLGWIYPNLKDTET